MVTPVSKRRAASVMIEEFRRSQTRGCSLVGLGRSTWRYKSRRPADEEVRAKLRELAQKRKPLDHNRPRRLTPHGTLPRPRPQHPNRANSPQRRQTALTARPPVDPG